MRTSLVRQHHDKHRRPKAPFLREPQPAHSPVPLRMDFDCHPCAASAHWLNHPAPSCARVFSKTKCCCPTSASMRVNQHPPRMPPTPTAERPTPPSFEQVATAKNHCAHFSVPLAPLQSHVPSQKHLLAIPHAPAPPQAWPIAAASAVPSLPSCWEALGTFHQVPYACVTT
jgi:hypothetical protein